MKKTILLLVTISLASFYSVFCQDSSKKCCQDADKRKERTEKKYWHFIKERLFDRETSIVSFFHDDITIDVKGATREDSLIINNLMQHLRVIIPSRRISYFEYNVDGQSTDIFPSISLTFGGADDYQSNVDHPDKVIKSSLWQPIKRSPWANGNQILYDVRKGISQEEIYELRIFIYFNDSVSFSLRKQYIEYAMVRSLCIFKGKSDDAATSVNGAILNQFAYDPSGTTFTDVDKFLLQKLYSPDFQKQFRAFMTSNYSWQYYMRYTNKTAVQSMQYSAMVVLALIIFILSYRPILTRKYKRKYLGYLMPGLFVVNSFVFIKALLFTIFDLPFPASSILQWGLFFLFYSILISLIAGVFSLVLYFIERSLIKPTWSFLMQLVLKVALLFLMSVTPLFLILLKPFPIVGVESIFMIGIAALILPLGRGVVLFLNHLSESRVRQKDVELSRLKELKAQAEIRSFQARINPHFLYNSLNSIAGLVHSSPDKTEKMALALSDLFRYSINRNGDQMSSVQDEITMVRSYLEIEQIRFGTRMHFSIDIDSGLEEQSILRYILQPLVENAIKHGISKIEGKGEINLSIRKMDEGIIISVSDNGPAFPEGLVGGYGLQSLYDLLELTYGENASVDWQNIPEKKIWVKINTNIPVKKHEYSI